MKQLLDTNIILYFLSGKLAKPLEDNEYYVSVITQLELLSYLSIDQNTETIISTFLEQVEIINLNSEIITKTVEVRKKHKLKLPDAIIVATAKVLDIEVLSNDQQFSKIPELKLKTLKIITI